MVNKNPPAPIDTVAFEELQYCHQPGEQLGVTVEENRHPHQSVNAGLRQNIVTASGLELEAIVPAWFLKIQPSRSRSVRPPSIHWLRRHQGLESPLSADDAKSTKPNKRASDGDARCSRGADSQTSAQFAGRGTAAQKAQAGSTTELSVCTLY
ncbi:hypothetical protein PoB_000589600 [Plakobranchus ocellatus]|uniref:Uncharacterized protein n=1 Tax=Plakobranchus ocellatus TaxID=259542 RepID=A0AAV3YAH0_9GAST|nr:hypothetical protein PoB_000589600 [Plakobranchus ocellatus]